jgi:hypothetical protein
VRNYVSALEFGIMRPHLSDTVQLYSFSAEQSSYMQYFFPLEKEGNKETIAVISKYAFLS